MPLFGGGAKKKKDELKELEKRNDELKQESSQLEENLKQQGEKNLRTFRKREQDSAATVSEHETMLVFKQSKVVEHRAAVATLRDHCKKAQEYIRELETMTGAGLEPSTPLLLVEAWEKLEGAEDKPEVFQFLGEEWLQNSDLTIASPSPSVATAVARQARETKKELPLIPRKACTRPAPGKCGYGSQDHLESMGLKLNLSFTIGPAGDVVENPDDAGITKHQMGQVLLSNFKLDCRQDIEKCVERRMRSKVFVLVWMWGHIIEVGSIPTIESVEAPSGVDPRAALLKHSACASSEAPSDSAKDKDPNGSLPKHSTSARQLPFELDTAAIKRDPPPSLPASLRRSLRKSEVPSSRSKRWRLEVAGINEWEQKEFRSKLRNLRKSDYSIEFEISDESKTYLFGRQHTIIERWLGHWPDVLKSISRQHLQFKGAPDGLAVKNLSRNIVMTNNDHPLHLEEEAILRDGDQLSFMKAPVGDESVGALSPIAIASPTEDRMGKTLRFEETPASEDETGITSLITFQLRKSRQGGSGGWVLSLVAVEGCPKKELENKIRQLPAEDYSIEFEVSQRSEPFELGCRDRVVSKFLSQQLMQYVSQPHVQFNATQGGVAIRNVSQYVVALEDGDEQIYLAPREEANLAPNYCVSFTSAMPEMIKDRRYSSTFSDLTDGDTQHQPRVSFQDPPAAVQPQIRQDQPIESIANPLTTARSLKTIITMQIDEKREPPQQVRLLNWCSPREGMWRVSVVGVDGMSKAKFMSKSRDGPEEDFTEELQLLPGSQPITLGRNRAIIRQHVQNYAAAQFISRDHFQLRRDGMSEGVLVKNLSPNIVRVGGQLLKQNDEKLAFSGDQIGLTMPDSDQATTTPDKARSSGLIPTLTMCLVESGKRATGDWCMHVVAVNNWTTDRLMTDLKQRPVEDQVVAFKNIPGSPPFKFGRDHRLVRHLLENQPQILEAISREQVEFSADSNGGLSIKNLGRNPMLVGDKVLGHEATTILYPGDRFSFAFLTKPEVSIPAPSQPTSAIADMEHGLQSPSSAIENKGGMVPVGPRKSLAPNCSLQKRVPSIPIMTLQFHEVRPQSLLDDLASEVPQPHDLTDGTGDDDDDFVVATLPTSPTTAVGNTDRGQTFQAAQCANTDSSTCVGLGGDALYRVFNPSLQQTVTYCAACLASSGLAQSGNLRMVPRVAQPACWNLLFQSVAVDIKSKATLTGGILPLPDPSGRTAEPGSLKADSMKTSSSIPDRSGTIAEPGLLASDSMKKTPRAANPGWSADFAGQQVIIQPPSLHSAVDGDEMRRHRTAFFAHRRNLESSENESHALCEKSLSSEASELEQEARKDSELSAQQSRRRTVILGGASQTMERLRQDASRLREELAAAAADAQVWYKEEAEAGRKARENAEYEAKLEAEKKEMVKGYHSLRRRVLPLEPPRDEKCINGGDLLSNHRRLLQLLCHDDGLLYQDAMIEVYATVHRPFAARKTHGNQKSNSPSDYHNHPAYEHSLWTELVLSVRAREEFNEVQFEVHDYDVLEVQFELPPRGRAWHSNEPIVLPGGAKTLGSQRRSTITDIGEAEEPSNGVKQIIRCELLDFISAHPSVTIDAEFLMKNMSKRNSDDAREYNGKVTLPIGITTFLKPASEAQSFAHLWETSEIAGSKTITMKVLSPAHANSSLQSRRLRSSRDFTPPWDAAHTSPALMAAITCGGSFRSFQLPGGTLGLGAELPGHGCIKEALHVLLQIQMVQADQSAKVSDQEKDKTQKDGIYWTIVALSIDSLLAQAALAAVATQLKCPPS